MKVKACTAADAGVGPIPPEEAISLIKDNPDALVWIDFDRPLSAKEQPLLVMRLADTLDTYRDILNGALDVLLSAVSNRLNIIVKRLTIVATIFMPLTFITGFWGMNFLDLPFASHPWFWGTMVFMFTVVDRHGHPLFHQGMRMTRHPAESCLPQGVEERS